MGGRLGWCGKTARLARCFASKLWNMMDGLDLGPLDGLHYINNMLYLVKCTVSNPLKSKNVLMKVVSYMNDSGWIQWIGSQNCDIKVTSIRLQLFRQT